MTGSLIWGHHFAMMSFWWYECIYIYVYRYIYIYNRVICMDFPETSMAYMAYMALFCFFLVAIYFPHSQRRVFFQDQRRTLATQGWLESAASGACLWWICFSDSEFRPAQMRPVWDRNMASYNGCHTCMVNVGKHTYVPWSIWVGWLDDVWWTWWTHVVDFIFSLLSEML